MRIEVNNNETKVDGYCAHPSWSNGDHVIGFNKRFGKWSVGTSRCLPSDLESAKIILECFNKAFEKVKELEEK
jgi:hypothetical protein